MKEKKKGNLAFLQALHQQAPQGVLILDENGLIVWANDTVANASEKDLIGTSGPKLLRQNNDTEILWPPDTKKINHRYVNGELMEMVNQKIPDSEYYLVTVHRLDGENGIKTIMEKRLAEAVAETAHDLKAPINGIAGFMSLIIEWLHNMDDIQINQEDQTPLSDIQKYAKIIMKEVESMVEKINRLLLIARLEQGIGELNITKIDMFEFTQNIIEKFNVMVEKSGIKLFRKPITENCFIHADQDLLKTTLEHMILNAIQALQDGDLNKNIVLNFGKDNDGIVSFTVINPGEISAENLQKMFRSQFTTKKYGNGLGTKTIRLVTEAHDGKPSVKCKDGLVYASISFPDAKI
jgi:signal transduction histidine kinase